MDNVIAENKSSWPNSRINPLGLINYQTLYWLFMVGSVLGFVLEGLWSFMTAGHWEHRSAVIWGPFCIIYGIGAVVAYLISQLLLGKHVLLRFGVFSLSGALVEYFSSLFQEICFGSVSWDYSDHFLNIGGRVSLQMALAWGILGVLFMRFLFPPLKRVFEKLNGKKGSLICGILTVFMVINLAATFVVVIRWQRRLDNAPPNNNIECTIDYIYGDEKMERLFPNMRFIESKQEASN